MQPSRPRRRLPWPAPLLAAVCLAAATSAGDEPDGHAPQDLACLPWRALLDRAAGDPALAALRRRFLAEARAAAALPVLRRLRDLQAAARWRVSLKYTVRPPHMSALADKEWEIFCLSQADNNAGALLKGELPRLAAAAVLTGETPLRERVLDQLEELATWEPLERRGWTLRNSKPHFTGDDGAWLGTGWLVRAIADSVDLLGPESLPPKLRAALDARLEAEIAAMDQDWVKKRTWYFRSQAAHSNQWILPQEALVRACLVLGVDHRRASYERGVANLLRAMDAQGPQGEFVEGLRYSGISVESLYSIARAAARAGDDRLRRHPFLTRFPTWLVHHFQPGGFLVNAFDSPYSSRGHLSRDQGLLATAAFVAGSPHALWALRTRAGFPATLDGLLAAAMPPAQAAPPPLWADYALATRLNWRSSWDDDRAAGFWLRGGHPGDFHDHMDRGHVNFIIGRQPLLIEAGTLTYAVPNNATHLRSVAGHNVLQIGDAAPERLKPAELNRAGQIMTREGRAAPIAVDRMDHAGGAATVDLSRCYASLVRWQRRVQWDASAVTIDDEVELKQPEVLQFRWHLGVPADAPTATTGEGRMTAGDVAIIYAAEPQVVARVEPMPDATLAPNKITEHACVVLRTRDPVLRLKLKTQVGLGRRPEPGKGL